MVFRATSSAVCAAAIAIGAAGLLSSPAAQAAPHQSVQLTGAQILSALLPPGYFPHGYTKNNAFSSGKRLENPSTRHNLATMSCRTFLVNFPNDGFGETAIAGDVFANRGVTQAFSQVVYQFPNAGKATAFYHALNGLYARCRTIRVAVGGNTYQLTTQSLTGTRLGGHQAFNANDTIRVSGPDKNLDGTTINSGVFVLAGTDVFSVDALGTTVPPRPSRTAAVLRLIARVQAAR